MQWGFIILYEIQKVVGFIVQPVYDFVVSKLDERDKKNNPLPKDGFEKRK